MTSPARTMPEDTSPQYGYFSPNQETSYGSELSLSSSGTSVLPRLPRLGRQPDLRRKVLAQSINEPPLNLPSLSNVNLPPRDYYSTNQAAESILWSSFPTPPTDRALNIGRGPSPACFGPKEEWIQTGLGHGNEREAEWNLSPRDASVEWNQSSPGSRFGGEFGLVPKNQSVEWKPRNQPAEWRSSRTPGFGPKNQSVNWSPSLTPGPGPRNQPVDWSPSPTPGRKSRNQSVD